MKLRPKMSIVIIFLLVSITLLGILASCQNKKVATDDLVFPSSTTFDSLLSNYTISKISITDGNTGEVKKTSDPQKIGQFLNELKDVKFTKKDLPKNGAYAGYSYSIDFYIKNEQGYYQYTLDHGFTKSEDFTGNIPTGNCIVENEDAVEKIIKDFYKSLN